MFKFKANCLLVGPGPLGDVQSLGIFLRDPSPYLREFRKKKTKNFKQLGRFLRIELGWVVGISPIDYSRLVGL